MPNKLMSIDEVTPKFAERSVVSLLIPGDRGLSNFCTKLLQADVQTVGQLSKIGPAGLRKQFKTDEKTIRRVRAVYRQFGVKFS